MASQARTAWKRVYIAQKVSPPNSFALGSVEFFDGELNTGTIYFD